MGTIWKLYKICHKTDKNGFKVFSGSLLLSSIIVAHCILSKSLAKIRLLRNCCKFVYGGDNESHST